MSQNEVLVKVSTQTKLIKNNLFLVECMYEVCFLLTLQIFFYALK